MINFVQLSESPHQAFAQNLYLSAFEADERREFPQILTLIPQKDFKFYVIEDSSVPVAILALWSFETFDYIEHFAVASDKRNRAIGTTIIQTLLSTSRKPVILEVEPPFTPTAQRRIKFYERLDFILLPDSYLQPAYSPDKKPVDMRLMLSDSTLLTSCPPQTIIQTLYSKVYNL